MRVLISVVRGVVATRNAVQQVGQAIDRQGALRNMARLGGYEMGAALQALPSSNCYRGDLGLLARPPAQRM